MEWHLEFSVKKTHITQFLNKMKANDWTAARCQCFKRVGKKNAQIDCIYKKVR